MKLKGSCHCQAIRFEVESSTPYPYQACYCGICRKVQGGGGFAINLGADARTLKITGKKHIKKYKALVKNPEDAKGHRDGSWRAFCRECGSMLWLFAPEWPELVHPFASAIDTDLPKPPERTHLMLEFRPTWIKICAGNKDKKFLRYPKESIADWHERLSLTGRKPAKKKVSRKK